MNDPFRPVFHFTPPQGWINDPNGLVHDGAHWHLAYQYYNPEEADSMQWGHARSTDLFSWEQLPVALPGPDACGQIWSGSAVWDGRGDAGFGPGIACLYTYWDARDHRQSQGFAFSLDGVAFAKHPRNPVIPQLRHLPGHPDDKDFRDPKVFWHAPTGRWVMVVAGGLLRTFSSRNLVDWRFEALHGDIATECPDLFEIEVKGTGERRWVLSGGGRWHQWGEFDGRRFTPVSPRLPMNHGPDCYATQTWDNAPGGRRVGVPWLFNWGYGSGPRAGSIAHPFPTSWAGGCLGVPLEFTAEEREGAPVLRQEPVAELAALRRDALAGAGAWTHGHLDWEARAFDLEFDATCRPDARLNLEIAPGDPCGVGVEFDAAAAEIRVLRRGGEWAAVPGYEGTFRAPWPQGRGWTEEGPHSA